MDTEHASGNGNPPTTQTESSPGNSDSIVEGIISISSSSSSSSSSPSSDASFDLLLELTDAQNEDVEDSKCDQESPNSPEAGLVAITKVPPQTSDWSMMRGSPRAAPEPASLLEDSIQANDWNPYGTSLKQSPPIQTMGRTIAGYDPARIPSSIFASKPAAPTDWSVASNESLFSIHMGNNSFSRDHAILLGKSEELFKFDDLISSIPTQQPGNGSKPNEVTNSLYNLPTVIEVTADIDNNRKSVSLEDSGMKQEVDITPKAGMMETTENHNKETHISKNSSNVSEGRETPTCDGARTSASTHHLSDESGTNSSSSFAFPVLTGEGGNNISVKATPEYYQLPPERPKSKPQPPPQPQKPNPKAAETRWFSWLPTFSFPRCSFCC